MLITVFLQSRLAKSFTRNYNHNSDHKTYDEVKNVKINKQQGTYYIIHIRNESRKMDPIYIYADRIMLRK